MCEKCKTYNLTILYPNYKYSIIKNINRDHYRDKFKKKIV